MSSPSLGPRGVVAAIAALALGGFAIGTTEFVSMGLLPQLAQGTGVSIPTAGHYISAYAIGVVVGAPTLAVLGAKVARRTLLIALMLLFAGAHALVLVVSSYTGLLGARFLAGVPHGAYFGIGSLVAASLVSHARRTSAVAAILGGLGVANVIGVPLATMLGQDRGWRAPYLAVGVLGLVTAVAVALLVPRQPIQASATMRREFAALRRGQVWFALAIGVVGFGGMFAMYSFITPTMTTLAGVPDRFMPWVLGVYGVGMTLGMVVAGRVAARGLMRGIISMLVLIAVVLVVFSLTVQWAAVGIALVFVLGVLPSVLVPLLQTRLMDVARDGQGLAAALNHSTLNMANALGAWLGSLVLAAGWGYRAPALVGAGLAVLGVATALASALTARRAASPDRATPIPTPSSGP